MKLHAWRLNKNKQADDAFTGEGARLWGGRWNSKGVRMVYAAESLALATLEVMVHIPFYAALKNYVCIQIDFEREYLRTVTLNELPTNWRSDPVPESCRSFGDKWIKDQESPVLKIPSVIIPIEHNYLFNPAHPDFKKLIKHPPQQFDIDKRLIK